MRRRHDRRDLPAWRGGRVDDGGRRGRDVRERRVAAAVVRADDERVRRAAAEARDLRRPRAGGRDRALVDERAPAVRADVDLEPTVGRARVRPREVDA